jgi:hypothetical protein
VCVELAQNPLVKRVIAVLDKNKDGNISFLEFVQGLNSLSAGASQEEKLRFAFQIYDINGDGFISNGELFTVLKMMVGSNLNDVQLQQLVDRTIIKADLDYDGKISFEEFCNVNTPCSLLILVDGQGLGCRGEVDNQLLIITYSYNFNITSLSQASINSSITSFLGGLNPSGVAFTALAIASKVVSEILSIP